LTAPLQPPKVADEMRRVFVACCLIYLCFSAAQAAQAPNVVNGIIVIVNDKVITIRDVFASVGEEMDFLERRYATQPAVLNERKKALQAEAIEGLVEHYLVLQEFNSVARPLPESYVDNRINEEIKQKFGDRLTMMKTLQKEGITYESYRQKIKDRIVTQLMWDAKVPRDPVISPTRIENYYVANRDKFKLDDRIQLRMILLTNRPNDTAFSPMQLAKEIAKKVDEGASFAEMAKVYSNGSSAAQGGDMGWVEKKTLREELSNVAFSLKSGTRSEPVDVQGNVFLMYVEKSEPTHTRSLSEVRQEIEDTLKAEESKRLKKQFVERLKKKAFVRYF
jgi:peptidyl-prolyl cis-trans isomerase SurA